MSESKKSESSKDNFCIRCKLKFDEKKFFPFCSERCQLIDLGGWAQNKYVIPGPPANEEQD